MYFLFALSFCNILQSFWVSSSFSVFCEWVQTFRRFVYTVIRLLTAFSSLDRLRFHRTAACHLNLCALYFWCAFARSPREYWNDIEEQLSHYRTSNSISIAIVFRRAANERNIFPADKNLTHYANVTLQISSSRFFLSFCPFSPSVGSRSLGRTRSHWIWTPKWG